MNKVDLLEQSMLKTDITKFFPGDTVKVHVRVIEGEVVNLKEVNTPHQNQEDPE